MLGFALSILLSRQENDPLRLAINTELTVQPGEIRNLGTGSKATPADIAKAADKVGWVFLGENHATAPHQQLHADIISALLKRHRHVIVGLEMYTRPKQSYLDQWSLGKLDEATFLAQSDWKGQWGYDFAFYRPIFDVVRKNHLPLLALNVPRDWVRAVGKGGFDALSPEARNQLPPDMSLENADHRAIFQTLMGGHPMGNDAAMRNIYSAQVLWDEGMADTALKYRAAHLADKSTVYVIIAGSGHVMYGQGIDYRIQKRTGETGVIVVMDQSERPRKVSRGVGDFVYLTVPAKKAE